jgi:hypothetical protein
MVLLGMQINQVMLLAGVGLFVFVMINRLRRSFRSAGEAGARRSWQNDRRPGQPVIGPREVTGGSRLRSAAAVPDHESWEVELHRLAREFKGEIDTKMRALEELIRLAEGARSRLDASIGRAESLGLSDRRDLAADSPESRSVYDDVSSSVGKRAKRARNARSNRETARSHQTTAGDDPGEDPRFERVYALADAGFSATRIAGQIGSQVSEVELILSLRHANQSGILEDADLEARNRSAA